MWKINKTTNVSTKHAATKRGGKNKIQRQGRSGLFVYAPHLNHLLHDFGDRRTATRRPVSPVRPALYQLDHLGPSATPTHSPPLTMSNAPNPSNAKQPEAGPSSAPKVEEAAAKKKLPQLGALEDDDEFEVSERAE